jgi:hypothetical protein
MSRWRTWRRRSLKGFIALAALIGVLYALMWALMWHWVPEPPVLTEEPAITRLQPEQRGDRVYLGRNWLGRREGLPVLYLTGTAFEMGYANGALTEKLIHRQEDTMVEMFHRFAPYRWTQFLLKFVVVYKNRNLADHVSPEHQLEVLGVSRGCPDTHPDMGPYYFRMLNYHAAQDISYMLMNSPLIRQGCTAFGAWGTNTVGGHLLAGRNFDWEAAPVFDEDRLLVLCKPAEGIPFVSLSWAGMVGCVSGQNRAGLGVTVNGAPSGLPGDAATPTCLVAREVLQHAKNLDEAIAILRRSEVFVSALFLVGSRTDNRFVVVEKTPEQTAVWEETDAARLVCANHYRTPGLRDTELNRRFLEVDTSQPRFDRLSELLARAAGRVDAAETAAMLRDRKLVGDQFAGNGHRSALNPLIATHAVMMDLTAGVFWAASPPHQLGRFVAIDVNDFERELPDRSIGEDAMLASGEYRRYASSLEQLEKGARAIKAGQFASAQVCAEQAERDNPGFFGNAWLLAESLQHQGRTNEAAVAAQRAWAGRPALDGQRQAIRRWLPSTVPEGSSPAASTQP